MLTCEKPLCLPVLALALSHRRALSHKQALALVLTLPLALAASLPMAPAIAALRPSILPLSLLYTITQQLGCHACCYSWALLWMNMNLCADVSQAQYHTTNSGSADRTATAAVATGQALAKAVALPTAVRREEAVLQMLLPPISCTTCPLSQPGH